MVMASFAPFDFPWCLLWRLLWRDRKPDLTAGTWPRPQALVNAPTREAHPVRASSLATAWITRASIGSIAVGNTAAIRPSRPIRYLWKFQRGTSSGRSVAAHL